MTEILENAFQLLTTGICMGISLRKGALLQNRAWVILALASGVFFLGDLYWELFLILYGRTPSSYIPYLSWYASYLFLLLLLFELREKRWNRRYRVLWLAPVFTVGMCLFYLQWGDWLGNVITAVFMCLLLWFSGEGLLSLLAGKKADPERDSGKAWIFAEVFLFCLMEYAAWTASCFGTYDSFAHPYFWFDTMLSLIFLLFPMALGKAVKG